MDGTKVQKFCVSQEQFKAKMRQLVQSSLRPRLGSDKPWYVPELVAASFGYELEKYKVCSPLARALGPVRGEEVLKVAFGHLWRIQPTAYQERPPRSAVMHLTPEVEAPGWDSHKQERTAVLGARVSVRAWTTAPTLSGEPCQIYQVVEPLRRNGLPHSASLHGRLLFDWKSEEWMASFGVVGKPLP